MVWNFQNVTFIFNQYLAKLAGEAMAEYHAGKTQELNPEIL